MEQVGVKIDVSNARGRNDTKIIIIDGTLDTVTSTQAEKIISPLVDQEKHLIVDCTNLSYVNSTGLAFLLKCYIQMKRREGDFKIVNPNKLIYEIMDITGALNLLEVFKNQEEAINSLDKT